MTSLPLPVRFKIKDGWVKHPLDEQLRKRHKMENSGTIPVRMIFNEPELNLRAEYSLFDRQTGRLICSGNGKPVSDSDKWH